MKQAKIYDDNGLIHVTLVDGSGLQEQIYVGTSMEHAEMAAEARADETRKVKHWILAHSDSVVTDDTPTPPSL